MSAHPVSLFFFKYGKNYLVEVVDLRLKVGKSCQGQTTDVEAKTAKSLWVIMLHV